MPPVGLGHRSVPARLVSCLALAVYLVWLAGQAFLPFPPAGTASAEAGELLDHVRLVPLASIRELVAACPQWQSLRVLVGNVALFVPIGLLLPMALPRLRSWKRALAAGLATGVAIELGQLGLSAAAAFPYRFVGTDDVLLNAAGLVAGFGVWRACARNARPVTRARD